MLKLISILICNEYFHMTKIIGARNVQTVCKIKPKPGLHISGLSSSILDSLSWILHLKSQVQGLGSLVLVCGS